MLASQRSALTKSILNRLRDRGVPSSPGTQPIDLMGQSTSASPDSEDEEVNQLGTQVRSPISIPSMTGSSASTPSSGPAAPASPLKLKKKKPADEEDLG